MFGRRRKPAQSGGEPSRREATTLDQMVRSIASDKSRSRFIPRPPEVPPPRAVFQEVTDQLGVSLEAEGWRYAKSGPHATRRRGRLRLQATFGSSHLNVAGELVTLHITLVANDPDMAAWRTEQGLPTAGSPTVVARHLGHLLQPPRWLDWNLADASLRAATVEDIRRTLWDHGILYLDEVADLLESTDAEVHDVARLLSDEAAVELLIRRGDISAATGLIEHAVARFPPRGRVDFVTTLSKYRRDGLAEMELRRVKVGAWNALPFLAATFDLPVDLERLAALEP